jgi:hypothetical protein
VLAYLLAHHDRVVPKQEILEHLWPVMQVPLAPLAHPQPSNSCPRRGWNCHSSAERRSSKRATSPVRWRSLEGQRLLDTTCVLYYFSSMVGRISIFHFYLSQYGRQST